MKKSWSMSDGDPEDVCLRIMCEQLSSEDENHMISSDEEEKHGAWNLFLEVVVKSVGHAGGKFFEDEEFSTTALSWHLSMMDLSCQEMQAASQSEDCQKVRNDVLKFSEEGICPPDTRAAGVAPSSDSLALVLL